MTDSRDIISAYLQGVRLVRGGSGSNELPYYPVLHSLLESVGKTVKPNVRPIMNPGNIGGGLPDGGLFTSDQIRRNVTDEQAFQLVPARGAIEVKGTGDDIDALANSEQVRRYCRRYGQVLATNLRDFSLVALDRHGRVEQLETYRLARDERDFWSKINHPRTFTNEHSERFIEYLRRVMLHGAQLSNPQDLAWLLASYARESRLRIENIQLHALTTVRTALENALGMTFEGERGDHFFRSTLVQTLFYGIFSAWVLWCNDPHNDDKAQFDWRNTTWILHVPMIRALFEQIATPTRLGALNLVEVLDWTGAALNRVDRRAFFERFEQGNAVQYFYEPFLEAFDPELRKDLGIWYTPDEVVRYMVARVDRVLRDELDLPDGLADSNVYVLDPATGTGSYLVEVLRRIEQTLRESGDDALAAHDVKRAAMERVIGFEILPAPFVVGHLQVGLYLQSIGAPLSDEHYERASIYLTNALTGWENGSDEEHRQSILKNFPELLQERDQARQVKQKTPVLVVLGNPPYNAFAGVSPETEEGLVEPYKDGLISDWGIKKFNLDDLYVRFFGMAERKIAEQTRRGVICFISNFSYLSDPSFVVMRQRFLGEFDKIWIDSLNGDSRETGKRTPDGSPDPSVFSTPYNRAGIRVGTAVGLFARTATRVTNSHVRYREFWGINKREDLLKSLDHDAEKFSYGIGNPRPQNRFSFRVSGASGEYFAWPSLPELALIAPINGLMEKRGGALIDIDRGSLERRMRMYFDPKVDWKALQDLGSGLTREAAGFKPYEVRQKVQAAEDFDPERVRRYAIRPFEARWAYYSGVSPLWNRSRPTLWAQYLPGNSFLMTRPASVASPEGVPLFYTSMLGDNDALRGHAYLIPLRLHDAQDRSATKLQPALLTATSGHRSNLSETARTYLNTIGITDLSRGDQEPEYIWMHALSIVYSPAYLLTNAEGIRVDWPRIPLPDSDGRLVTSAGLGRQVAALLDTESSVPGVTTGTIRSEVRVIAPITRHGGGGLNPDGGDLALTAGWGYAGQRGVTMPGKGRAEEREFTPEEREAIETGVRALGLEVDEAFARIGDTTFDVYLNDVAYWRNVPSGVWAYTIGGYQVMKKWLSYREEPLLGRSLTVDEAREVTNMARRIAALLLLGPALDANYLAVKASTYAWPVQTGKS